MARRLPTGTVTFLFTDIEGSTRLLDELGDGYADALAEHRRALREAFAAHGGVEVDTQGDAFFFAFARASDAVAAAASGRAALENGPIRVRTGLHTGEPQLTSEGYVGLDVHRGARIAAAAHGGQVLASQTTRDLADADFRDLGRHRLKDLGEPTRLYQLGDDDFPPLRTLDRTNLPLQTTTLVGRTRELSDAVSLLRRDDVRLVTVVGPGGAGKTRLALHAAAELAGDYPDGVFFVPLALVAEPELVRSAVADSIEIPEDELAAFLRSRHVLLVLDNFEHLHAAAREVVSLLADAPSAKALVTSRSPLRVSGERELPISALARDEAVALFYERARAVRPDLDADDASVAEICSRLDGLPLAIELAAARVRLLSPDAIRARLDQSLPLLTGGARDAPERQQTLRATIAWSYELLDDEERGLLDRLAVFAGGFTVEAAEEIADATLDRLESLADKSLVARVRDTRLTLLETIREFALERLGDREDVRERHAAFFLTLAEDASRGFVGPDIARHTARLEEELDNLRAALSFLSSSGRGEDFVRLAVSLQTFWEARNRLPEGDRWLERAVATEVPPPLRAQVLSAAALHAYYRSDHPRAAALNAQAGELHKQLGDTSGVAAADVLTGWMTWAAGDLDSAREQLAASLAVLRACGDERGEMQVLHNLGELERDAGRHDEARVLLDEAVALARRFGDLVRLGSILHGAGDLDLDAGDLDGAAASYVESLELNLAVAGDRWSTYCLAGLAAVAMERGDGERAGVLWGAVLHVEETVGTRLLHHERPRYERRLASVNAAAVERGRRLSLAAAAAYALGREGSVD